MKEWIEKYGTVSMVAFLAWMAVYSVWDRKGRYPVLEVGQTWIYETKDPFDPKCREQTIVALRDGYVQYSEKGLDGLRSYSSSVFLVNARLAKEGEGCPNAGEK